jgi:hypothetical protein
MGSFLLVTPWAKPPEAACREHLRGKGFSNKSIDLHLRTAVCLCRRRTP